MNQSPLAKFARMTPAERRGLLARWNGYQTDPRPGHHDLTVDDAEILIALADATPDTDTPTS